MRPTEILPRRRPRRVKPGKQASGANREWCRSIRAAPYPFGTLRLLSSCSSDGAEIGLQRGAGNPCAARLVWRQSIGQLEPGLRSLVREAGSAGCGAYGTATATSPTCLGSGGTIRAATCWEIDASSRSSLQRGVARAHCASPTSRPAQHELDLYHRTASLTG
jgi:hypothetical protein